MASVLLIGGTGFLSGTMAQLARQQGDEVWILTRGKRPVPDGFHAIIADRIDRAAFAATIAKANVRWDLVIDCIGFSADDARQDLEALAGRAGHLVFISTDSVITPRQRPWRIDETFAKFHDSPYALGKRAAEEVLLGAEVKSPSSGAPSWTILRPCHIYGPGSLLGCLPAHGRDPQLIDRIRRGVTLNLVGGGHFLQHPVFAADLWTMARSCLGNDRAIGQIYFSPGPDIVETRVYYQIIARVLGAAVTIHEIPVTEHLAQHPDHAHFCCHRVYDMDKARKHGLAIPTTPLEVGLRKHVESLIA